MERSEEMIKEHFKANLKASEYNKTFNEFFPSFRLTFDFILQFLHETVKAEKFKGSKILEVGSGATVHNIASFSSKFTNIVQSDYVIDNCDELKRWHAGTSALDWSRFLDIVLHLEGKQENLESARRELEDRIKNSVKAVVRVDLLSDQVILEEEITPEISPPFDVISSVLCLETAAPDFDGYVEILKRLNNLLRKGGGVVICGYENGSPWNVGDNVFHHVKLSLTQIKDALMKAGFGNIEIKTLPKFTSEYEYDYDNLFCLTAEKL